MTTKSYSVNPHEKFKEKLQADGFSVEELKSGKTRFTRGLESYLYSPLQAVAWGTWLNESKCIEEALPKIVFDAA